uniref:Uncharacterized protein n=1 Tax=Rhizophora mucronata TaxID=61149 RepID=A0A2P2PG73_RHIMU
MKTGGFLKVLALLGKND